MAVASYSFQVHRFLADSGGSMETLHNLGTVTLRIPAWEMALYIGLLCLAVVCRKTKCFILTAYAFAFYWGYVLFSREFLAAAGSDPTAQSAYLSFGLLIITFGLISFFYEER
jgi:hypothetical protein